MKPLKHAIGLAVIAALLSSPALAADRTVYLPLEEAVAAAKAAGKIDDSVRFYLAGSGPKGKILQRDSVTNKKTNAFAKSDAVACQYAAQSAIIALHTAAKNAGANAVTNIVSFYKRNEYKDAANYECHAGNVIAGVALKGDLSKVQ